MLIFSRGFELSLRVCLCSLVLSQPAQAILHKCTDANNKIYYQDRPCQELKPERLPGSLARLAGVEEERAFLWKAVGAKGTVYLFGSLYYGKQTMYPLQQMVMEDFNNSNVLLLERDIRELGDRDRISALAGRGRYDDKTSLKRNVKEFTWNRALQLGKKLNLSEETLSHYKPWLAAIVLSTKAMEQAGYSSDMGLVQSFSKDSHKLTLDIESIDEQIKLFEELSPLEQEQFLLLTIQDLNRSPEAFNNFTEAWQKGDLELMDQLTRPSRDINEATEKLNKLLHDDRVERISNKLKELTNDDKTYFFIVSVGLMGGERGLLKELERKGFKVTQP